MGFTRQTLWEKWRLRICISPEKREGYNLWFTGEAVYARLINASNAATLLTDNPTSHQSSWPARRKPLAGGTPQAASAYAERWAAGADWLQVLLGKE